MPIRITSGSAKGRSLKVPKSQAIIRPALAQVREAIFSSLGDVSDAVLMDIFAGTGSLGLEALSRDCKMCYFVDGHDVSIRLIIENVKNLGFEERAKILKRKLPLGLNGLKIPEQCDVIFCDPPYEKGLLNPTLMAILKNNLLKDDGWILAEHNKHEVPNLPQLEAFKTKTFGQTTITYLKRRAS